MQTIRQKWRFMNLGLLASSLLFIWAALEWTKLESTSFWFKQLGFFSLDSLSLTFIILTTQLIIACIIITQFRLEKKATNQVREMKLQQTVEDFIGIMLMIEIMLIICFASTNLYVFYIGFEATLMPMFLLIGRWGARAQKNEAAYYLYLFTVGGSLILLIALIIQGLATGSGYYPYLRGLKYTMGVEQILWLGWSIGFSIKLPSYLLHTWLPKAHVEAPMAGSVLLAGILLKLGGYGYIRFILTLLPMATKIYAPIANTICLFGVVLGSWTTLRQVDLKRIIAYSSVAHMALLILGVYAYSSTGVEGGWFLMLAHGITSPGLFIMVSLIYWRRGTRTIFNYSGLAQTMPLLVSIFFIFSLGGLGLPLTINFVAELLILFSSTTTNVFFGIIATTTIIWAAAYSLHLFQRMSFGKIIR